MEDHHQTADALPLIGECSERRRIMSGAMPMMPVHQAHKERLEGSIHEENHSIRWKCK